MDKESIIKALKNLRENSKKRKFKQTIDLIVNLKDINFKDTKNQVDIFVQLHYSKGKKSKVCALVGPELVDDAKKIVDKVIVQDEFEQFIKDKKLIKRLVGEYDFFLAQANIMPKVAQVFGKVLGPRGKMPNPKAGCVVPPKFNLKPLYDNLQKTVRVRAKDIPMIQTVVGTEEMEDKEILDNIEYVYSQIVVNLPKEEHNIKAVTLKLTMGKPVRLKG